MILGYIILQRVQVKLFQFVHQKQNVSGKRNNCPHIRNQIQNQKEISFTGFNIILWIFV
jgi:hypothetical protein